MLIDMKMLVFFPRKCVRTAAKTMVVNRKNQTALALLTGRCAERVRSRTDNKDFSPSTKKTTECYIELFLSINKIEF